MKARWYSAAPESATDLAAGGIRGGSWPALHSLVLAPVGMAVGV